MLNAIGKYQQIRLMNRVKNRYLERIGALQDNMLNYEINRILVHKHVSSLFNYIDLDILPIERILGQ
jgi:hypothetical protein